MAISSLLAMAHSQSKWSKCSESWIRSTHLNQYGYRHAWRAHDCTWGLSCQASPDYMTRATSQALPDQSFNAIHKMNNQVRHCPTICPELRVKHCPTTARACCACIFWDRDKRRSTFHIRTKQFALRGPTGQHRSLLLQAKFQGKSRARYRASLNQRNRKTHNF